MDDSIKLLHSQRMARCNAQHLLALPKPMPRFLIFRQNREKAISILEVQNGLLKTQSMPAQPTNRINLITTSETKSIVPVNVQRRCRVLMIWANQFFTHFDSNQIAERILPRSFDLLVGQIAFGRLESNDC